jgi:beta-glucanase (GH16 family)
VDPDTPSNARTRTSTFDGSTLNLVFSDEFNQDGRTFYPGDDPFWTAPNIWYGATQDMEWYGKYYFRFITAGRVQLGVGMPKHSYVEYEQ